MFGVFRLTIDGIVIERWKAGRARALLQFLLANCGRPLSRAELIDNVWQDSGSRAPETALKVAVHTLRQLFADAHARGPRNGKGEASMQIGSHGPGYAMRVNQTLIDANEFERLLGQAAVKEKAGRRSDAVALSRRASQLCEGLYLPDCTSSWAAIRRECLKDLWLTALDRQAKHAEHLGDRITAAGLHHQMLRIDPCREESYQSLMCCHAELGQLGRVREWHQTCVEQLAFHLDLPPGAETERAYLNAMSLQHGPRSKAQRRR